MQPPFSVLIQSIFFFAENRALYELIGAENVEQIKTKGSDGLKKCFSLLMHSNDSDINSCIAKLSESFLRNGKSVFCCCIPTIRDN